jgi:hypothetical protein
MLCVLEKNKRGTSDGVNYTSNPLIHMNIFQTKQELDKIDPQKPTQEISMQVGNLYLFLGLPNEAVIHYKQAIE